MCICVYALCILYVNDCVFVSARVYMHTHAGLEMTRRDIFVCVCACECVFFFMCV